MKLAIMQPYFFPYLGYYSLIKNTDKFIILDSVQFSNTGWVHRNRILNLNEGWTYINIPLKKHQRKTNILDIEINNEENWSTKILSKLNHYKNKAPFYKDTINIIENCLLYKTDSIVDFNYNSLKNITSYLGINFNCSVFSKLNLDIEKPQAPDEWCLNICKAYGNVTQYWNPPGGKTFYNAEKYIQAGLEIKFQKINLKPYKQFNALNNFQEGLSIIDVMMFNSVEEIQKMLNDFELI